MANADDHDTLSLRSLVMTIVDEIVARVHPVRVILFGSVARGDARPAAILPCSWFSTSSILLRGPT